MSTSQDSEKAALVEFQPESQQTRVLPVVRSLQVTALPDRGSVVLVFAYYQDDPEEIPVAFEDLAWSLNQDRVQDLIQQLQSALDQLKSTSKKPSVS